MTDEEREQAAYCVARHYVVFYKQTLNGEKANCWDACMYCKLKSERCNKGNWEWIKTVDALLRESGFAVCPIVGGYEAFGSYEQAAKVIPLCNRTFPSFQKVVAYFISCIFLTSFTYSLKRKEIENGQITDF